MSRILAIDAGSARTAWCLLDSRDDGERVVDHGIDDNDYLVSFRLEAVANRGVDVAVFEWMTPRGLPTSAQEFETLWWIGRLTEVALEHVPDVVRLARDKVKYHLTGRRSKVNDSNVRAALIDRFGDVGGKAAAVGVKAKPGPLYGVASDVWAALAVAVTYADDPELVYVPKAAS